MKIYVNYRKGIFDSAPWKLEIHLCKEDWRSVHSIPRLHGDIFLADIRGNEIKELEIPNNYISLYGWAGAGKTEHIQIKNLVEGDCIEFVGYPRRLNFFVTWDEAASLTISVNINKEFDKRDLLSKYSQNQIPGWNSTWTSSWKPYLVSGLLLYVLIMIFELISK